MKTFRVDEMADSSGGEYVLGVKDTGTHACYLIYGTLAPGEEARLIKPGKGHEEILMAITGTLKVTGPALGPAREIVLPEGSAFHVAGDAECFLENPGNTEARYVAAGGHSSGSHH